VEAGQHSGTVLTGGSGTPATVDFAQSGGVADASVFGGPTPRVSASTSGVAFANASLTYFFEVEGPASGPPVKVGASLRAAISYGSPHDPNVEGVAGIRVDDPTNGRVLLWNVQAVVIDGSANTFSIDKNYSLANLIIGRQYRVTIDAYAESNSTNETAYSFVDPDFYIDPTFPDANQYYIRASDGITSAAVPEPVGVSIFGTMTLFLVLARRKRSIRSGDTRAIICSANA